MSEPVLPEQNSDGDLLGQLQSQARELDCLYRVEEALGRLEETIEDVCPRIIEAIPPGWQHPEACVARIKIGDQIWTSPNFIETAWGLHAEINSSGRPVGRVSVYYIHRTPSGENGPFLKEEARLLRTIATRIGQRLSHQRVRESAVQFGRHDPEPQREEWRIVLQMLEQTDRSLYLRVVRRMLNHLCWSGVKDAESLLEGFAKDVAKAEDVLRGEWNQPHRLQTIHFSSALVSEVLRIAAENLTEEDALRLVQKWIQEDKLSYLVQVVNRNLSLSDVADAIRRYHHLADEVGDTVSPNKRGIEVSLIRRLLSDQLQYINVAKNFIEVRDFYQLLSRVVYTSSSQGRLGGKSAGLYLATQILKKKAARNELLADVRVPRTWYVASDSLIHFMHYNDFDEVVEQKYKPLSQVRFEYPHIVQTFKNAHFPADIVNGLSVALDELGERPLIVRSSSLLEDRIGAAFSGKYCSLFLANQGPKRKRLEALLDAIAEVYASMFGPDPMEYRAERGLIDVNEEMGIMIQEVVGNRVGKYFLPTVAGVAFSNNEFRWSPRIDREDGLLRLVPGLGTRAVDRLNDDYPVLLAPGNPSIRVTTDPEEIAHYSPRRLDVLNLETNAFETIDLRHFLENGGEELPGIHDMVSLYEFHHLRTPSPMQTELGPGEVVVTFDGLVKRTDFCREVKAILDTLRETLGVPVDIEFASDGRHFYLLQCRPQNLSGSDAPAAIPRNAPAHDILFTTGKHIGNGQVPNITHIVYVEPHRYAALETRSEMLEVGRAVGYLNKLLPKRQFVLIGPGRWGSRGDIRLGVSVTYADISNAGCLIEVARRRGSYIPELSFGTHFFQDLVETGIRYLPLYPDEEGTIFNEHFLLYSHNSLVDLAPEFAQLGDTVRVIDVPSASGGKVLNILMNADMGMAMGVFEGQASWVRPTAAEELAEPVSGERHWRWRMQMIERLARQLDADKLGVVNLYLLGSTKNATAGPSSDVDLIVHFRGEPQQLEQLKCWLAGWSQCLAEANYIRTGVRSDGLLDVRVVTDDDIARQNAWAAKISAPSDAARPLPIRRKRE
ncbi:MAG: PEP/pyruvate-binding domain-containing protein [Candidatus Zixiibacteriota bacterium]